MKTLAEYMKESHQTAKDKGWWEEWERNFPEQLSLQHSELSEVLEEYRNHKLNPEAFIYTDIEYFSEFGESPADRFVCVEGHKPEGIAVEYADLLIRIFDTCERYDIPLEKALQMKMAYNKTRPHRHGGKAC